MNFSSHFGLGFINDQITLWSLVFVVCLLIGQRAGQNVPGWEAPRMTPAQPLPILYIKSILNLLPCNVLLLRVKILSNLNELSLIAHFLMNWSTLNYHLCNMYVVTMASFLLCLIVSYVSAPIFSKVFLMRQQWAKLLFFYKFVAIFGKKKLILPLSSMG